MECPEFYDYNSDLQSLNVRIVMRIALLSSAIMDGNIYPPILLSHVVTLKIICGLQGLFFSCLIVDMTCSAVSVA